MENEGWTRNKICHWCGKSYQAVIGDYRRRFCSKTCKQAHYRAYKNYVTHQRAEADIRSKRKVTRKKH